MRGLIQRVMSASVEVDGVVVSSIERGICVLIGITQVDHRQDREWMVRKLLNLRLFEDKSGAGWCKSVSDLNLEILCVSQFTLYGVLKGNKPDFHNALTHEKSKVFYEQFVSELRKAYKPELVKDGVFGADMQVRIQNDGPVTLMIEPSLPPPKERKPQGPPKNKSKKTADAEPQEGAAAAAACATADVTAEVTEDLAASTLGPTDDAAAATASSAE
eukprot:scpid78088/ scgid34329/ D-tyrosyl-tRNA(Tyr) deacylase 1